MDSLEDGIFGTAYSEWFGMPVLLFVVRECQIPIPCSIVSESITDVRIRIQPGWEIDVPKELILAVEQAGASVTPCMN